jgi:hypothetical protein
VATWSRSISTSATIPVAAKNSRKRRTAVSPIELGEEVRDGPVIGHPGVLVADGGGKEFEEAADGGIAGAGDSPPARRGRGARGALSRVTGRPESGPADSWI